MASQSTSNISSLPNDKLLVKYEECKNHIDELKNEIDKRRKDARAFLAACVKLDHEPKLKHAPIGLITRDKPFEPTVHYFKLIDVSFAQFEALFAADTSCHITQPFIGVGRVVTRYY